MIREVSKNINIPENAKILQGVFVRFLIFNIQVQYSRFKVLRWYSFDAKIEH